MTELFDFLNSITTNTNHLMSGEESEKQYLPVLVNKGLSQHIDCILYANEMNCNGHLDNLLQYDYLFHSIRRMKRRYGKWSKAKDDTNITAVSIYYRVSNRRAKEYLRVLNKQQISDIMEATEEIRRAKSSSV